MSIWTRERVPGVTGRHALGLWLTYRKVISAGYVPGEVSRSFLKYKVPLWYPLNFALTGRLNSEDRIVTSSDAWLTYLMGTSSLAAGFRLQIYDSATNQRLGDPLNFGNSLGSAQHPYILRKPYCFHCRSPILIRVQNQDTTAAVNNIQVVCVLYGE
jgi:hypothetical protein